MVCHLSLSVQYIYYFVSKTWVFSSVQKDFTILILEGEIFKVKEVKWTQILKYYLYFFKGIYFSVLK